MVPGLPCPPRCEADGHVVDECAARAWTEAHVMNELPVPAKLEYLHASCKMRLLRGQSSPLTTDLSNGRRLGRSLPSRTERIPTDLVTPYRTVTFGWIGKAWGFGHGMTELDRRLQSLRFSRGTPLHEINEQCRRINDMAPTSNR